MNGLLIDAILLILTTTIAFHLYHETKIDGLLIGGAGTLGNALYTIYGYILGIPNMWIVWDIGEHKIFSLIFIGFILMSYYGVYTILQEMERDDDWLPFLIVTLIYLFSVVLMFFSNHTLFEYTGYAAISIAIMGLLWYKRTSRCFNPFKC